MEAALRLAEQAFKEGEVPIGAVIVGNGKILGKGYNQTEKLQDPTAHAEMLALTAAGNAVGGKFLQQCALYVTIEPCAMCAGALQWARIGKIVYGAKEEKFGYSRHTPCILHPKTQISSGLLAEECLVLMRTFFNQLRSKS
jgi:tRNA(adenine34) deaminase